ncbi:hypothetical protein [Flavobacterium sp. C3NV]|uniref:hypothetical protein n=1 Tax=Flavobacterium sp. C3NV TaxID=3393358 RepID=UPI0039901B79
MDNLPYYSAEELQKCPFHNQQNAQNNVKAEKETSTGPGRPDESATDPKRYEPGKFEKGSNENSGGDGTTESAAEHLDNL